MTDHAAWSARLLALAEAPEIDWPAVMAHLPSRSERAAMKSAFMHVLDASENASAIYRAELWMEAHEPESLKAIKHTQRVAGTPMMARMKMRHPPTKRDERPWQYQARHGG